jgi:hypothetical protein
MGDVSRVDQAGIDSFPASDPPSWWAGTGDEGASAPSAADRVASDGESAAAPSQASVGGPG